MGYVQAVQVAFLASGSAQLGTPRASVQPQACTQKHLEIRDMGHRKVSFRSVSTKPGLGGLFNLNPAVGRLLSL